MSAQVRGAPHLELPAAVVRAVQPGEPVPEGADRIVGPRGRDAGPGALIYKNSSLYELREVCKTALFYS